MTPTQIQGVLYSVAQNWEAAGVIGSVVRNPVRIIGDSMTASGVVATQGIKYQCQGRGCRPRHTPRNYGFLDLLRTANAGQLPLEYANTGIKKVSDTAARIGARILSFVNSDTLPSGTVVSAIARLSSRFPFGSIYDNAVSNYSPSSMVIRRSAPQCGTVQDRDDCAAMPALMIQILLGPIEKFYSSRNRMPDPGASQSIS
jgi:hypothetical protein